MSLTYESFGKYILLEKFAMGGMAEIYLARNSGVSGVSKFVAIKRILPQFTEQTEFIDMFKDEAKIAINLAHVNIVSIHEFGIEKNQFFLAMDYIEGKNLRQILNKMKKSGVAFSVEQVLYVIAEVAKGLDAAHRCIDANTGKPLNIIHRDMSPQNIMVSYEGEVKIVDFGIAKAETQLETTRAGTLKGKFGYMSPEQAEGQPVDLRTDIFALGIVLWELLANDRLFVANNEVNTLRKIRDCQVPSLRKINPNIPQELERIVGKALSKDRNLRYQTSAAFHRELSRFLNRQFPDFSPHDFSVFVKTLFAAEILDCRKKIVEYAKLEVPAAQQQMIVATPTTLDKTVVTQTDSETAAESSTDPSINFGDESPRKQKKSASGQPARGPAEGRSPNPLSSRPIDRSNADPFAIAQRQNAMRESANREDRIDTSGLRFDRSYTQGNVREGSFTNATYSGSRTFTRSAKGKNSQSNWVSTLLLIAIFGCLIGGGGYYFFYPERATQSVRRALASLGVKGANIPDGATENASVGNEEIQQYFISITSNPSGATIFVDGKQKGDTTPAQLKLDRDKQVRVRIVREGYMPFEELVTVTGNLTVSAILHAERKGYLDINVVGAGEIFIDGQKIASGGPANGVPVPADRDMTISVVDPVTRATDKVVIRVGENKIKRVTLIPRANVQAR